jgi:tetratricopeptide (TPR) repeat protein
VRSKKELENQLILHLNRYASLKDKFALPYAITQDGIAEELGILRNHVPALMRGLEERGLVYDKKSRVVGAKNRRKTYFLTEKGMELARNLSENKMNAVNLRHIPRVEEFFGREDEIKEMKRWLRSKKRVLVITGMEGIGKTSLVAEFLKDMDNVLWYDIRHYARPENLLKEIKMLNPWSMPDFKEVLKKSEKGEEMLAKNLDNMVIVLDSFQNASDEFSDFVRFLANVIDMMEKGRLILISPFSPDVDADLVEIKLDALPKDAFEELVTSKGISGDLDALYEQSGGIPSMLLLFRNCESKDLEKCILSIYSEAEIRAMEIGALYEEPMEASAFLLEKSTGYESLMTLIKRGVFERYGEDHYALSSILKKILRDYLPEGRKKEIMEEIGEYLSKRVEVHHRIMGAGYFSRIGEYKKAKKIVIDVAKPAITGGYWDELKLVLEDLPDSLDDPELLYINGNIADMESRLEDAMKFYKKSEVLFSKRRNMKKTAESIRKQGEVLRKMGKHSEAMETYHRAMKLSRNTEFRVKVYDNMGTLALIQGDREKGKEYMEKAMEYARKTGNDELIGLEYNSMGNVYLSSGKWAEAEECYEKSIELLKNTDNRRMLSIAMNNLAICYYQQMKLRKASRYWKKSAQISRELRDISFIYPEVNRANASFETGDFEDAEEGLKNILDIVMTIDGYHRIKGAAFSILGHIEKLRGNMDKAIEYYERALKDRIKAGEKSAEIRSKLYLAEIYMMEKKYDAAEDILEEAEKEAHKSDFKEELFTTSLLRSRLLFDKGDIDKSRELLKEMEGAAENDSISKDMLGRLFTELGRVYGRDDRKESIRYLQAAEKLLKPMFIEKNLTQVLRGKVMGFHGLKGEELEREAKRRLLEKGISQTIIEYFTEF